MKVEVICAGLGRTGTTSLKAALELLGFGPCYHMLTVFERPQHVQLWRSVMDGDPDWDTLLGDFRAVADEPPALYWKEILDQNPNARVILTTRDANDWYDSVFDTAYQFISMVPEIEDEHSRNVVLLVRDLIFEGFFGGQFENRTRAVELFRQHNAEIERDIDASKLLVFDLRDGWAPLCQFLKVKIPDCPFPHLNTRVEFQKKIGLE